MRYNCGMASMELGWSTHKCIEFAIGLSATSRIANADAS
jgi:hypothetical protein